MVWCPWLALCGGWGSYRGERLSWRALVLQWEILGCHEITVHFWVNEMWGLFSVRGHGNWVCRRFTQAACLKCRHLRSMTRDSDPGLYFFLPQFIFISWRLITLQYCSGFCHTLTWISHGFTCIPHPDPPSHLPIHPIPLGLPSAPGLSTLPGVFKWGPCVCVVCGSRSVVSDSLWPRGLQPARLLCPWNSPGKNTARGTSQPRDRTLGSCIAGRFFTVWATGKSYISLLNKYSLWFQCRWFMHQIWRNMT